MPLFKRTITRNGVETEWHNMTNEERELYNDTIKKLRTQFPKVFLGGCLMVIFQFALYVTLVIGALIVIVHFVHKYW